MLHITVVLYEKGDSQTQKVQEKKQIKWKKSHNAFRERQHPSTPRSVNE